MSANTYGRQVTVPLTNKSGGGVVAGDVVIIDTATNTSFTTTTSAGYTGMVGVAQETIASNAVGRVLISGYAALVTPSASVTRGHFGATHTVAKQAAAAASRAIGSFCQFLSSGATPDAVLFGFPDASSAAGNVATDAIWDAAGDTVIGTGPNTASRVAVSATPGKLQKSNGTTLVYDWPVLGFAAMATPGSWPATDAFATTAALAAVSAGNGGALAVYIPVPAPMALVRYLIRNNDTANARAAEIALYYSAANGSATATRVTGSEAVFSFTPTVASARAASPTGGTFTLQPGGYWCVIRNTSATQTFGLATTGAAMIFSSMSNSMTLAIAALAGTLDLVTSWTHSPAVPALILQGSMPDGTSLF